MKKKIFSLLVVLAIALNFASAEENDSIDMSSFTIVAKKSSPEAPVFITEELDTAILGMDYECRVKASSKWPDFELQASGLPYGMSIDKDGTIQGKAYLDGVYKVYLKAKTRYHETIKGYDLVVDVKKKHRKYYYLSKSIDVYPNKFEDNVTLEFNLNDKFEVSIDIYDKYGNHVKNIVKDKEVKGFNEYKWNGLNSEAKNAKDGFYVVVFEFRNKENQLYVEERKVLRSHRSSQNILYSF